MIQACVYRLRALVSDHLALDFDSTLRSFCHAIESSPLPMTVWIAYDYALTLSEEVRCVWMSIYISVRLRANIVRTLTMKLLCGESNTDGPNVHMQRHIEWEGTSWRAQRDIM